jgi:type III secretion protein V
MADAKSSGSVFEVDTHGLLTRYSDIMLAGLIILIIGMMLLPLPHIVLDILLTANISIGVVILLVSLYISEPVKIASFPTILLLATMFRLALEVAVTRLILGEADAGEVVDAFGNFVAAGNLVVGGVVFLIITIVQFLVIAKGAERISEVAARFTLDAMPGKQMSIDADLRAGAFDLDTARIKRRALERESQFYGSMDGAMKFVKGDAIAGLIIVAVNIVGGLTIGILQRDMSAGEAAAVYTILTIGSGLVSQISALLVSTSAGLVTTRVASEDAAVASNLGSEIGSQLLDQPKAILIAGAFLGAIALVPGLPKLPFFVLSGILLFIGYSLKLRAARLLGGGAGGAAGAAAGAGGAAGAAGGAAGAGGGAAGAGKDGDIVLSPHPTPVILDVSPDLSPAVAPEGGGKILIEKIPLLRRELYDDLGIRYPGVRVRSDIPACGPNGYIIRIFEVPLIRGTVPPSMVYAEESAQKLGFLGIEVKQATDPATGREACWVPLAAKDQIASMNISVHDTPSFLVHEVRATLKRHAAEFLGIQEVQGLLDEVARSYPTLVKEVVPKLVSTIHLTEILQRLVQEDVAIRDMRAILQSLARWAQVEKDTATLTEYVRSDLKQYISFKFSRGTRELSVYLLDPAIEGAIRNAIQRTPQGSYLALDPDTARRILAAARKSLGNLPATASQPVILTAVDVRRYLKKLLELDLPFVTVLSYQEISPLLTIQPVGRITMPVPRSEAAMAH